MDGMTPPADQSQLLGNPNISLTINELRKQAADSAMMTKADVSINKLQGA